MTYFRDKDPKRYKSREHYEWDQGKGDEWDNRYEDDIPWKDDEDDNLGVVFTVRREYDAKERLGTATWYHWCGWDRDAKEILNEIAAAISDESPYTYEETRFEHENNDRGAR